MGARVTQKDVAIAAGVHPSTVSLALEGRTRIPKATRLRIVEVAKRLGYVPDPMLRALALYRAARQPAGFRSVLAWLVHSTDRFDWRRGQEYRGFHEGAAAYAAELGYRLEVMDLRDFEAHPARMRSIWRARGIQGVLVCPQPDAHTVLPFDLDEVAAVAFGRTVHSPQIHSVAADHFESMLQIMAQLRRRGYQRIGYALPRNYAERVGWENVAAFLAEQTHTVGGARVPPFEERPLDGAFQTWLEQEKPDAIVTTHYDFPQRLAELEWRIPEDIGVALVSVVDGMREFSGIDEGSTDIGRAGAQLVVSLVESGQRGVPARPQRVKVKGFWCEGRTLRPAP